MRQFRLPLFVPPIGRSSGGGTSVHRNLVRAAELHPHVLSLKNGPGMASFIPRNVVPFGRLTDSFVLMPQNAWPWAGESSLPMALKRRVPLRLASEVAMRRALGVIRIGASIPSIGRVLGDILPNVIDSEFETDLALAPSAPSRVERPAFLCVGSLTVYRGLDRLFASYDRYRAEGGLYDLHVLGPRSGGAIPPSSHQGVTITSASLPRASVLAAMRRSAAVIFPSTVEASPLTLLEANELNSVCLVSDIPGHRQFSSANVRAFNDVATLTSLMHEVEVARAPARTDLARTAAERALSLNVWCDSVAHLVRSAVDL